MNAGESKITWLIISIPITHPKENRSPSVWTASRSSQIPCTPPGNPRASQTDLLLHFFLLDLLSDGNARTVPELGDAISLQYGEELDTQIIRLKMQGIRKLGILLSQKTGKFLPTGCAAAAPGRTASYDTLLNAVKFSSETAPFSLRRQHHSGPGISLNNLFCWKALFYGAYTGGRSASDGTYSHAGTSFPFLLRITAPFRKICRSGRDFRFRFCEHPDRQALSLRLFCSETALQLPAPGLYL